jgi:hypothetical protein
MFSANGARVIAEKSYATREVRRQRPDIVRAGIASVADRLGLTVLSVTVPSEPVLCVAVRATGKRVVDQDSEILEGGDGWVRRYFQRIRTTDAPLREQVYGLVQWTWGTHESFDTLRVEYCDEDAKPLGLLIAGRDAREYLMELAIEEARRRLDTDTLPDVTIPVIERGPVRPG